MVGRMKIYIRPMTIPKGSGFHCMHWVLEQSGTEQAASALMHTRTTCIAGSWLHLTVSFSMIRACSDRDL